MKEKKFALFLVLSFFFLFGIVNAEGNFKKEWETEKVNMYNEGEWLKYYLENNITPLGDGYANSVLFIDVNSVAEDLYRGGVSAGAIINSANNIANSLFDKDIVSGEIPYKSIYGWVFQNTYTQLNYYDVSGKITSTKKLNDTIVLDLASDGGYLYSLEYSKGNKYSSDFGCYLASLFIRKYDKSLNVVASVDLDDFLRDYVLDYTGDIPEEETGFVDDLLVEVKSVFLEASLFANFVGIDPIDFKDDKVGVFSLIVYDKDLKKSYPGIDVLSEYEDIMDYMVEHDDEFESEEDRLEFALDKADELCDKYKDDNPRLVGFLKYLMKYYADLMELEEKIASGEYIDDIETDLPLGYAYGSKYNVAVGSTLNVSEDSLVGSKDYGHVFYSRILSGEMPLYLGLTARLVVLDHDNNVILAKDDKDYVAFYNVKAVGDYITCLGIKLSDVPSGVNSLLDIFAVNDTYHMNSDLLIFDKDGNLVQKLVNGRFNTYYEMDDKEILLSGMEIKNVYTELGYEGGSLGMFGNSNTSVYRFAYIAKAIQNEGGNIVIPEAVVPGDIVEVAVLPKKGYTFDYLLITYPDGRTDKIKDTSFVMPNEDVTVEAIYKVGNPNTGDIMIITTVIVLIASCCLLVYKSRKKKLYW